MAEIDAVPEIGFGDFLLYFQKYGPLIGEFIMLIKQIESGTGTSGTLAALKTHLGNKRLTLGPTPYLIETR